MQDSAIIDGRYRLLRVIGIGGMGSVYEAEHVAIGRRVAIKVLHVQFSQHPDLVERLRREAEAASRIGHPNIVDVTDFGRTADGSAYLAMEFLHGTDLGAILREKRSLPESRALSIGLQTAQALAAAHRVGIVHRDLKPENIFIVNPEGFPPAAASTSKIMALPRTGSPSSGAPSSPLILHDLVKVLDFGIAVQLGIADSLDLPASEPHPSRPGRLTNPGLTVGTPEYMAPEQALGQRVDARADIYAVGTLLFEMVCGRVPYVAPTTPELLTMKTDQPAPSPRVFAPSISVPLEKLILACIERDPAARPPTMEAVEDALQEMVNAQSRISLQMAAVTQEIPPPPSPASLSSGDLLGRVAVPANSAVTPPAAASGSGDLSAISSAETKIDLKKVRPRLSPEMRATLGLGGAGLIMIIGFASARYLTHRADKPSLTSSAPKTREIPVAPPTPPPNDPRPAMAPPSSKLAAPPSELQPTMPVAPATHDETRMLLEWAQRTLSGRRYTAPPGDNLKELLDRIETLDAKNSEAKALRSAAVKTLNKRLRDELNRRHALDALDSFRALRSLDASKHYDVWRKELVYQLLFLARSGKKGMPVEPLLLAAHGAVELAPGSAAAQLALGDVLALANRREAAAASYRKVLDMKPRESETRLAESGLRRLGKSLPEKGKHSPTHK